MEMDNLMCHGCGSGNVEFDAKRRVLICHQCGKEEYYSRATLNSSGKVVFSKQNAIRFFLEGKAENANHFALDVLNISKDNAPALYIMAYNDEFVQRKDGALKHFFTQVEDIALEYEEVRDLIKMFTASSYNLMEYEFMILSLMASNMQSDDDIEELSSFIEQICPIFISKRTSMGYLNSENCEIYRELAEHCNIPKTCFALIKSIQSNPDSPCINDTFYLKAKAQYFYDNYIVPIGNVIKSMKENDIKEKFVSSYEKIKEQYENKLESC